MAERVTGGVGLKMQVAETLESLYLVLYFPRRGI
jgi:hypothetical protein